MVALAVNVKLVPVLTPVNICGSGLAPLNGLVKLIAFNWAKTVFPTTTLTGTVTLPLADWNTSFPRKVPGVIPFPGRFASTSPMITFEVAVPLTADALSQLPPSTVLVISVQFSVPVPPFRIWIGWLGGVNPLLSREKLTWPGRLSKKVPPAGATVKDTGTVMVMAPTCDVNTICPVYVPAASVAFAFTTTRMLCGIAQRVQPL